MKSMRKKICLSLSLALFAMGVLSLKYSWNQAERMPAAIASLSTEDIGLETSGEILQRAKIRLDDGVYNLSVPSLASICASYEDFQFVFTTPNVHVSGEAPSITISGACSDLNGNYVLQIPYKKLQQERAADLDISMPKYSNLSYKVREVIGFWPEFWVLSSAKFVAGDGQVLVLDEKAVAFATNNQLSMRWK